MGAGKFPEENLERFVESSGGGEDRAPTQLRLGPPTPRLRYCPLCFDGYLDEAALDNHLARKHGKQHVYLKVNDRIVRDICWLKQPLTKCVLVLLQFPSLEFELNANGHVSRHSIHETASLMEYIASNRSEGEITIRVEKSVGSSARCYRIFLGKQPEFRPDRLDGALIALMRSMEQNGDGDLVGIRDKLNKKRLNDLESRYLDGVLEYCHGWQLEVQNNRSLARDRLESAMDLLMPFQTDLANDARCALALRMNCFAGQWGCDDGSLFRSAEFFFCHRHSVAQQTPQSLHLRDTAILLDAVSQHILEAVKAYYLHDNAKVLLILETIRQRGQTRDRNDEDKLLLIEARTRVRLGDTIGAAQIYEMFRGHLLFGEEASKFKNSRE